MALGTIAQQITEKEAELVLVKAQMAAASAGGQSITMGPLSVGSVNYAELRKTRVQLEKDLQRLYRGGRGIVVDMSQAETETASDALTNTTWINRNA